MAAPRPTMPWAKVGSGTCVMGTARPRTGARTGCCRRSERRPVRAGRRPPVRPPSSATGSSTGAGPAMASRMSFFRSSACVPKMACTLLPTSITPAAPRALSRGLVDLVLVGDLHPQPGDAGVDVDQVLPTAERGDQPLGLGGGRGAGRQRRGADRPPSAWWAAVPSSKLASCSASNSSSGSRPGVRRFHHRITSRNST